ncbi:MAG: type II toxin-antitoxin system RelE/ParE family toxin [Okeania sp. SIO3I5]|uniref:type II toxin-antitoxin system RelE/ParE family toxin n=1 Tax=Okeania sp. SIO3I5 TaxID=2607805 RepID=UPI0013B64C3D|nr:type II toxin-antitoxin system RelE/ParE family toxin [Okeania sp. SIO3I5]NEQ37381.1 type II toxin-antitoxin system RelE/ParE family toxin [Okeania sp. SIO3I5]
MIFQVEISPSALSDAENVFLWIQQQNLQKASEWYNGFVDAILSLETFPNRCTIAPESADVGREIRQLIYNKHRILFVVKEQVVQVLRVRHTAQDSISIDDL